MDKYEVWTKEAEKWVKGAFILDTKFEKANTPPVEVKNVAVLYVPFSKAQNRLAELIRRYEEENLRPQPSHKVTKSTASWLQANRYFHNLEKVFPKWVHKTNWLNEKYQQNKTIAAAWYKTIWPYFKDEVKEGIEKGKDIVMDLGEAIEKLVPVIMAVGIGLILVNVID